MYERDEFLRDRIRPHQPGTPRGYSPRPPSGDRCPAPPPGRHAAAATPPGPPRLPSAPLRPLPDPAWPRQPEAPPPSTWADPALAPIRSRTRPGERGWRRMVRLVTFGLVGLGRSGMQRQEAQFEATIRTVLHGNHKVAVLGKGGVGKTSVAACVGSILAELRQQDRIVGIDADTAFGRLSSRIDPRAAGSFWELTTDTNLRSFTDITARLGRNSAGLYVLFVGGRRGSSVTVSDKTLIRFGDPPGGKALTFEVVRPSDSAAQHGRVQPSADLSDDPAHNAAPVAPDPGVVRAGAAAAARRRELDISQRSLAADGIINAGALIAFEKGRSWPRERTRAKLEEVLQWPAGTIARIRRGEPTEPATNPDASPGLRPADGPASLIAQAVTAAVDGCSLAIAALPATEDPEFTERAAPILADLRQLEAIAVQATRISRITPELIKALGAVRRHHDELMRLGATAPGATLAQRLYAARRRANLSTLETAQAAGVAEEMIVGAEAEEELPAEATEAIEALIRQIN